MKKKLLSLALVFVMALTLLPTAAFAADGSGEDQICTEHVYEEGVCSKCGAAQPKEDPAPLSGDGGKKTETSDGGVGDVKTPDGGTGDVKTPDGGTPDTNPGTANQDNPGTTNQDPVDSCPHTNLKWEAVGNDQCKQVCPDCSYEKTAAQDHNLGTTWENDAATHYKTCTNCNAKVGEEAHTYKDGVCTVCGAKDPNAATPPAQGTHSLTLVPAVAATCTRAGNIAYYKCSTCPKYFEDANATKEITLADTVISATGHRAPATGVEQYSDTQHKYTCANANCPEGVIYENHNFVNNTCTVCGFIRTVTPSPSSYVRISSAYVNSYSISVTWYSDMPSGTYFDIYVDGSFRTTVAPSRSSSGYFSYTVDFSYYLGDSYYNVSVYLHNDHAYSDSIRAYNRYYDHDYDYWYDHYYPNTTPSTNSSGIPYASQVNGRYSASEAIRILRNTNHNTLQYDLLNSTSASNSFYDLEQAVKRVNNVSVQVDIDRSDVPSAIRNIRIVGAAFNASSTNSTVRLVVDAPAQGRYTGYGYAFSMSLTGVGGDSSLDVPVKITMPVPSDISANSVRILHYHNSGAPDIIEPKVSGSSMSFTVTGFSDFVVTDRRVDPYYYYYTPGVPASARRNIMEEHLAVVLPILASMPPSGYVFDDVPPTHWAATEIAWARDGGMMSGYYDGTFRPYAATTRQELWMVLARLAGARPADMWAAREWAMNAGISDGRNPHSPLSRQQMISMLYRYAQYLGVDVGAQATLRGYRDSASISGYARNAIAWAIDQGIIAGDADGLLHPQDIATRADFAVYLYRFIY